MNADQRLTREALEDLLDAVGEARARRIVSETGRPAVLAELERVATLRLAMRLLLAGAQRYEVRDRLVSRGMSKRSAYRAIEAALGMGPRNCASNGAALAHESETLEPFKMEQCMESEDTQLTAETSNIDQARERVLAKLKERRDSLAREVNQADSWYATTQQKHRDAIANKGRVYADNPLTEANRGDARVFDTMQSAAHAVTNARHAEAMALIKVHEVVNKRTELAELDCLLSSHERLEAYVVTAEGAKATLESARSAMGAAQSAHEQVVKMLDDAEAEFQDSRGKAASELLATVKSGGDVTKVKAASRDKIATLDLARMAAEQEVQAARAALSAATSRHQDAMSALQTAHRDVERLHQKVADEVAAEASRKARQQSAARLASPAQRKALELLAAA